MKGSFYAAMLIISAINMHAYAQQTCNGIWIPPIFEANGTYVGTGNMVFSYLKTLSNGQQVTTGQPPFILSPGQSWYDVPLDLQKKYIHVFTEGLKGSCQQTQIYSGNPTSLKKSAHKYPCKKLPPGTIKILNALSQQRTTNNNNR